MVIADWRDVSTALSVASITASGVATAVPEPFSKALLALGVALANAGIFCAKHKNGEKQSVRT